MEKLNPQQIARLHNHLILTSPSDALMGELLDHLICEVEHYLWIGLPVESAIDKVLLEANPVAIQQLGTTYQRELALTETQLQEASLDDIVFEFRNKSYGAFDLRQTYRKTLRDAMLIAIGVCMMGMALLHGISQRTWSYLSPWGAVWLIGLGVVTFAGISGYLRHLNQQRPSVQ